MAPRLTTWYRRASMTAESRGALRITLDERLTFCRAADHGRHRRRGRAQPGATSSPPGPARILEIKHWGDAPGLADPGADRARAGPQLLEVPMGMAALNGSSLAATAGAAASRDAVVDASAGRPPRTPTLRPTRDTA